MTARQAHMLEREVQTWLRTCPAVADAAVVLTGFPRDERVTSCRRCGIASVFPGISFDTERVCSLCRDYEIHAEQMMRYFGDPADFVRVIQDRAAGTEGKYDCVLLYSGGKDSSYVLFRLLDLGLRVMTFTFDNGFISRTALRNVETITRELGVEHVTLTRADQPAVFRQSLNESKSVCNGCFRSLLELGHQVAAERLVPTIVTGLSRGQIIDERLSWFYRNGIYDPEQIERDLALGGQVYRLFHGGADRFGADGVEVVDFYRYTDVAKDQIRARLAEHPSWQQPADTGFCSSNCLINDAGVYVHQLERGYHNYESPTRWEVRIGHLDRAEADQELAEPPNRARVRTMLAKIGYTEPSEQQVLAGRMIAYVQPVEGGLDAVKTWAATHDGVSVKPERWVGLAEIPWDDGELDVTRLPRMSDSRFDAAPAAPSPADEVAGYLEPAVTARVGPPSGPRVRAVVLGIEPAMSMAELRLSLLAAFRKVPEARLRWSGSATPVLERRTWQGAPFRRLDLAETNARQWERQVAAVAGRLRKRHDPREGCLQVYVLDGPDGAQALILTADESGLGPRGLAPFVAELGAMSGRWGAANPDSDQLDREIGPPDEPPAGAARSQWSGAGPDALLARVLSVATEHGLDGRALVHGYPAEGTGLGEAVLVHARPDGSIGRTTMDDLTSLPAVEVIFYDNAGRADWPASVLPLEPGLARFDAHPGCVLSVDVIPSRGAYEVICSGQEQMLAAVPSEWGREVTE